MFLPFGTGALQWVFLPYGMRVCSAERVLAGVKTTSTCGWVNTRFLFEDLGRDPVIQIFGLDPYGWDDSAACSIGSKEMPYILELCTCKELPFAT